MCASAVRGWRARRRFVSSRFERRVRVAGQEAMASSGTTRPRLRAALDVLHTHGARRARRLTRAVVAACAIAALALGVRVVAAERTIPPLPERLSATGLFVSGSTSEVRPGVVPFSPQYPLWSDGATKRRWIYLPPGTAVDATRPDAFVFPRGTRVWKEFSLGRRIETRLIERLADGSWRFAAYVWNEDGSDAILAPESGARLTVRDAPRGRYAVPSRADCLACHEGAAVPVLGFSALQLSADRDPLAPHTEALRPGEADLPALVARGLVRNLPPALLRQPPRIAATSPVERAALGYLHANCGHCHAGRTAPSAGVPVDLALAQQAAQPGASASRTRRSMLGAPARYRFRDAPGATQVVTPGASAASVLVLRMHSRDPNAQMPPLGTTLPDREGLALVQRWIDHELVRNQEMPR